MTSNFLEISNNLSQLLAKHNISEAELGRQTNIPRGTINRLVTGKTPAPRASTLEAIAHFFKISSLPTVSHIVWRISCSLRFSLEPVFF